MNYMPPHRAMRYLLTHSANLFELKKYPKFTNLSDSLVDDIIEGAAQFVSGVLAPLNKSGDVQGIKMGANGVQSAPGFKEAYQAYVQAGWQSISACEQYGGMGLPQLLNIACGEMVYGANMAFGLCPMLTSGAHKAMEIFAPAEIKNLYLPKMITGEWSGAMNLTESHAGSDLGALKTKAIPDDEGRYKIKGQKIFITWGEHDCAENIIHLILARLPNAPEGSAGLSLFLAPRYLVNEDGSLGEKNNLKAISVEHKLGIHASPTCVMEYNDATAWLIGAPHKGLACMFVMMNEARLHVGVQGIAIGERAYQGALLYAQQRIQGDVCGADGQALAQATPIVEHADIRRELMDMKARLMAGRALAMATAKAVDIANNSSNEQERMHAHIRECLLTPLIKSYGSDTGTHVASRALQVFGGMGFIEETGAAQHYRDARIAPIYEGTNGIQAIDFIGRKTRKDKGNGMQTQIAELEEMLVQTKAVQDKYKLGCAVMYLQIGIQSLKDGLALALAASERESLAMAVPYQNLCATVIGGALLIESVVKGMAAQDTYAPIMQKLTWYHSTFVLSQAPAYLEQMRAGDGPVFGLNVSNLADL